MAPNDDPTVALRRISDAQTLRALTHPVRIALMECLTLEGPLTATQASELIGESPTTCSFHLRQLARFGIVEEAGGGKGRNRPWKMSQIGMTVQSTDLDAEGSAALSVLTRVMRQRYFSRLEAWELNRQAYPKEWQEASGGGQFLLYVTVAEAEAVQHEVMGLLMRYQGRIAHPELRPLGSEPVEVLVFTYPVRPPGRSGGGPKKRRGASGSGQEGRR
ncbi:MAG: winged helix-turn-helix domain-containing protein [Candidatus Dormibacteria bacterium]